MHADGHEDGSECGQRWRGDGAGIWIWEMRCKGDMDGDRDGGKAREVRTGG